METGGREEDFLPQKAPSLGNAFPSDSKGVEVANHVDIVGEKQIAHSTIFFLKSVNDRIMFAAQRLI